MTVNDHNTILPSCNYAYVNAIALATDEIDFISRVKAECNTLHFTVEESEDVGLLCDCENTHHLDNNLRKIANWAKKSGEVSFTTFHGSEE